jgi:hypothetical protein
MLAGTVALVMAPHATTELKPPTGYRTWFHVNSSLVDSASGLFKVLGGLHHIYINPVGQPALVAGGQYPAGTIFVDDIHTFTVKDHVYNEGPRAAVAVMVKDPKEYAATGGWGFQAWAGGDSTKPLVTNATTQCFNCHLPQQAHQFVFSTYIP